MNGNILRRRMVSDKEVEYEEYPYHFKVVVNCTAPGQEWNLGYNINGSCTTSVIFDGVDVTSKKNNYVTGTNTVLKCPTVGEHTFYLQFWNAAQGYYIQLMNNMRIRRDCQMELRTGAHGNNIQYIDSLSMTPPRLHDALPSSIVRIRVPKGAKAAYDAATYWKDKKSKIVEYNFKFKS